MTVVRDLPREYTLAMRKCTSGQRAWLRALQENGFRPHRTATKLGLGRGTASRWRRMPHIQAVLAIIDDMAAFDFECGMGSMLAELKAVAKFDMRRLYNDDGTLKHPKDWDDETAAAIQGMDIEQRHTKAPDGTTLTELVSVSKPRAYNKLGAIEQILRIRKLDQPQRIDVTTDGKPLTAVPDDAEIARRLLFLIAKGVHAADKTA